MPSSRSDSVSRAKEASARREPKLDGSTAVANVAARPRKTRARSAAAAPTAGPRKPRSQVTKAPQLAAPTAPAVEAIEAPRLVAPPAPPPAPQVRQTPPVLIVVLTQVWTHGSAFVRGPGRAAALAGLKLVLLALKATLSALKSGGILLAKMWRGLKAASRRPQPKAPETGDPSFDAPLDAVQIFELTGRIPPHQRHLFAQMNNC